VEETLSDRPPDHHHAEADQADQDPAAEDYQRQAIADDATRHHTEERGELIRKHSPSGLMPVLHDGDLLITDSLAIAEYLA